jgi:hypothetical protein
MFRFDVSNAIRNAIRQVVLYLIHQADFDRVIPQLADPMSIIIELILYLNISMDISSLFSILVENELKERDAVQQFDGVVK